MLRFEDVAWAPSANDEAVLSGLSFELKSAEWWGLTGSSGGGKTTLLSLAAGLLKPDSGTITLFGEELSRKTDDELSQMRLGRLGLIFQHYHLDDTRTSLENILLPGYFFSTPWFELKEKARSLGVRLGLDEHLNKPVSVLSGGQRQRVAVARALLGDPELILADEPTGALDGPTADLVLDLLDEQCQRGAAVLTVTHDEALLKRCGHCRELSGGRLHAVEARI